MHTKKRTSAISVTHLLLEWFQTQSLATPARIQCLLANELVWYMKHTTKTTKKYYIFPQQPQNKEKDVLLYDVFILFTIPLNWSHTVIDCQQFSVHSTLKKRRKNFKSVVKLSDHILLSSGIFWFIKKTP